MFVALLKRAKRWKQSKYPAIERIKVVYLQAGILFSLKACCSTDEPWKHYAKVKEANY